MKSRRAEKYGLFRTIIEGGPPILRSRTLLLGGRPLLVPIVKRVKDADGAVCRECDAIFTVCDSAPWGWRKSQYLHEDGTKHTMDMFAFPKEVPWAGQSRT